ncbi:hypothetical protein HA402_015859 [Bradysia odoriphaga]|nr:hypothetical protein HA402_015859 [Bradysia odoriphaga]
MSDTTSDISFDNTTAEGEEGEGKRKSSVIDDLDSQFCKRSCSKLYLDGETADVHFIFNENGTEEKVPAHKYMLAIGSPVFKSMFYGDLKEEGDVSITDSSAEPFMEFLQFFYLANVKLTIENAAEVMNLVNKYGIIDCFSVVETFLMKNFSMAIAVQALELSITFDRIDFRQFVLNKVMEKPVEFFSTEPFKYCSMDLLKMILNCENFDCDEICVFRACISWSEMACIKNNLDQRNMTNIREQLKDCLYQIQFGAMKRQDVSICVAEYSDLFISEELVELIAIVSGNSKMKLKYFVSTTRVKPIQWNENAHIMISMKQFTESIVKQSEITYFKATTKMLLGAIATQIISGGTNRQLHGVLKIRKLQQDSILLEQPFVAAVGGRYVPRNITKLTNPVVVLPHKVYEVRIDFDSPFAVDEFSTKKCLKYKHFTIQDHSITFGNGIASYLYFN